MFIFTDEFDMGDSDEEEQEELPSITAVAENGKCCFYAFLHRMIFRYIYIYIYLLYVINCICECFVDCFWLTIFFFQEKLGKMLRKQRWLLPRLTWLLSLQSQLRM